jgi:hypothetical protein
MASYGVLADVQGARRLLVRKPGGQVAQHLDFPLS